MKKFIFMACLSLFALLSCDKKDGDWPAIKLTKNRLEVPSQGGTVQTMVKNYKSLWLIGLSRDGMRVPTEMIDNQGRPDMLNLKSEYRNARSEGQTVTITVQPSDDGLPHKFVINVEIGDAFGEIIITQLSAPGR